MYIKYNKYICFRGKLINFEARLDAMSKEKGPEIGRGFGDTI